MSKDGQACPTCQGARVVDAFRYGDYPCPDCNPHGPLVRNINQAVALKELEELFKRVAGVPEPRRPGTVGAMRCKAASEKAFSIVLRYAAGTVNIREVKASILEEFDKLAEERARKAAFCDPSLCIPWEEEDSP